MTIIRARRSPAFVVSAVLSVSAHLGAAALWLYWPGTQQPGAVQIETEAISVEIVPSSVLESSRSATIAEPAASQSAVAAAEGATEETAASAPPPSEPDAERDTKADEPTPASTPSREEAAEIVMPRPDFQPDTTISQVAELIEARILSERNQAGARQAALKSDPLPEARKPEPAETAEPNKPGHSEKAENKKPPNKERERRKDAEARQRGGAASRASEGSGRSASTVSASAGQVSNYAAQVRARVAGNKPSGNGTHGTVVVSFGVSTSGGLRYASVARSSGNSSLDQGALAAVRNASPFPPPPAGAASGALSFSIPFHFQ